MHIVLLMIYGFTIYASGLAYALIARPAWFWPIFWCAPLIVSGSIAALVTLDTGLRLIFRRQ